jgi:hypothetical protein
MKTLSLLLALSFILPSAYAENKPSKRFSALKTWFQNLKEGLMESSVNEMQQKRGRVAAVAAVRGSKQGVADPDKPEWKSGRRAKRAEAVKQEREELSSAVDLVINGKLEEGITALDAFEQAHPKSPLLIDAKQAREKAKQLAAEPQAEEEAKP